MQDKKVTYEYAVIRVVPQVEREEFINVGVLVHAKRKRYLGLKYHLDERRLLAFAPELDIALLQNYLQAWTAVCAGQPQGGYIGSLDRAFRFRWLTAPKNTILQTSRIHPGLCEFPAQVLEELFAFYVAT